MTIGQKTSGDIKLEAAKVSWGREQCRTILFVDDVAGNLTDEYFDINTVDEDGVETQYYVLMDGTTPAIDPAPAGKTLLLLDYADGDDAATLAALLAALLVGISVKKTQVGALVTYENVDIGAITVEDSANAPSLTAEILSVGIGGNLGLTAEGGSILNIETQTVEFKADQTAQVVLGEAYTGSTATVEMTLIEMTKVRWETIVGSVTGDIFTPAGGTRLVGQGTSRLYQNLFDLGGKLILHPIRLPAADKSFDLVFWRSAPKPNSISFSGQDIQGMEVTFVAYNDSTKPEEISLWAQGDYTQDLV